MYERFTDRARKVMQLANQEAHHFNHEYVGTEHILLGLVKESSGVAANVLKNLDIDLRKIRLEVEKIVEHGPGGEQVVMGRLPRTPRAKKVIDYSVEEARNLNHNYVGTEHLLLGLLREQEGVAAQVLMNLDMKLADVREEVLTLLGRTKEEHRITKSFQLGQWLRGLLISPPEKTVVPAMYERFTDDALKVMQLANLNAKLFNHEHIDTQHILLGLVEEGSSVASRVLKNLNVDLQKVRSEVENSLQRGDGGSTTGRLPHSPQANKVLDYALEEARGLKHNYVGTEHLLLGLMRVEEGLAAKILINLNLKIQLVRDEVLTLLGINISGDIHIPPSKLSTEQLNLIRERIRLLTQQKEDYIAEQEFLQAAQVHDEAEVLKVLLAWYDLSQR